MFPVAEASRIDVMTPRKKTVWSSKWFSIEEIEVGSNQDSAGELYYGINAPNSVGILPITPSGQFVFVKQFRPVLGRETIELPAGMIDHLEPPLSAARRELKEETGMTSRRFLELGSGTLMASRFSNRLTWYLALDVTTESTVTAPELEPVLMAPEEIVSCERDLGADQLLALGIIALAKAKFPGMVPAVW